VLDLIAELRRDFDTAILFISHNLGVMARICDRVGVMYAGELVEQATARELFADPQHPYTQGLLRSLPRLGAGKGSGALHPIPGRVPPPGNRPAGCVFNPRCAYVQERCRVERPALRPLPNGSMARCHFAEVIDPAALVPTAVVQPAISRAGNGDDRPILRVEQLQKHYPLSGNSLRDVLGLGEKQVVRALDDATFAVLPGQTLGIVGESGSGKSTLVRTIIGLESSSGGRAEFLGFDISGDLSTRSSELIRELQMVFQNPEATMNPAYTVGRQIARPLERFGTVPREQIRAEVVRLLDAVRLGEGYYDRLPRQLSGGEKQRVGIARALASRPDLVLCDEPVSSLDVSVQAALLNLLLDVQREYGTTMIFIAHDLSVVRAISDHVAVMYLGEVVDIGPTATIYAPPYHPYTEALLSAVPVPDPTAATQRIRLQGTVPSAVAPPPGCRFHTRCPRRVLLPDGGRICETEVPPWRDAGDGHRILCHIPLETLRALPPVVPPPQTHSER
jgi:peptide/nickel transport system ATP-binding protein